MSTTPIISVGILTKNGGELFRACIKAVSEQEIDQNYEIVVLDSGSTDDTIQIATKYGARIEKYSKEHFDFGSARDELCEKCEGEIIVHLSQDAIPQSEKWLAAMAKEIVNGRSDFVQGTELNETKTFYWEKERGFYLSTRMDEFFSKNKLTIGLSTVCLAGKREHFVKYKFSPSLAAEDKFFQSKLPKDLNITKCTEHRVHHSHSYNLKSLFARGVDEGIGLYFLEIDYNLLHFLLGLLHPKTIFLFLKGLLTFKIYKPAEFFFPIIRPTSLWLGRNFYAKKAKRAYSQITAK